MILDTHQVTRPERWTTPFGEHMSDADVARLLAEAPFSRMNPAAFPHKLPLTGILRNDARLVKAQAGEILIREGDYGHSAFLILSGKVRVLLKHLPRNLLGRGELPKISWLSSLARWWTNPAYPEVRAAAALKKFAEQSGAYRPRIFLQDIPTILGVDDTVLLNAGEVFGELAALTRTPRSATIIAEGEVELLEIRWQGLRDILRYDQAWKKQIDALYRSNSLRVHLRETPLLQRLAPEALQAVADATEFLTFGNFDWQNEYRHVAREETQQRVLSEPLIAAEGDYPQGLYLIRNGFARLSRKQDSGEKTLAYLGKGDGFGMRELASNWQQEAVSSWSASLRAVGYVDVLRIPTPIVEQFIFPTLERAELSLLLGNEAPKAGTASTTTRIFTRSQENVDTSLMEFLVENRFLNGTAAMVIDLDRCTRCDDCVKACAATHGNNPRFNREGPKHEKFMVAHACMHCADPVCMIGCPTGAIHRESNSGLVVINDDTCIGCSTCANSCPYQNIQMVAIRNPLGELYIDSASQQPIQKATKCDFCIGLPGGPACVRACPHDALERVDLHDVEKLASWSQA